MFNVASFCSPRASITNPPRRPTKARELAPACATDVCNLSLDGPRRKPPLPTPVSVAKRVTDILKATTLATIAGTALGVGVSYICRAPFSVGTGVGAALFAAMALTYKFFTYIEEERPWQPAKVATLTALAGLMGSGMGVGMSVLGTVPLAMSTAVGAAGFAIMALMYIRVKYMHDQHPLMGKASQNQRH